MAEKMMILTNNYRFGEDIRTMADWSSAGIEIVSVEYNGAIGLEQFSFFKPRIVLLDSMVPIIGTDKFVEEMTKITSDFLVILLDDLKTCISDIQNIYRVIDKSAINGTILKNTVLDAVAVLNRDFADSEEYDVDDHFTKIQEVLGKGGFSIAELRYLRESVGLLLTPQITILLPRPARKLDTPVSKNLVKNISNILKEYNGGEAFVMEDGVLCIFINKIQGTSTERIYDTLLFSIRRALLNEHPIQWTFILSRQISLRKLETEFADYREVYNYGYFCSELQIMKKEYISVRSLVKNDKNLFYLDTLIQVVDRGEDNEITEIFQALYMDYLKKLMDMEKMREWRRILELLYLSFRELYGLGEEEISGKVLGNKYHTIEEEREAYEGLFHTLHAEITKEDKKINSLMFNVVEILIESYGKELSLQAVAEKVNIAPTYLSHLFRKEMKITFSDYLTEVRIWAAKRMLLDEELKIHEIALKAGFSDNRYFSKVFKKNTGKSPSEYRRRVKPEREEE